MQSKTSFCNAAAFRKNLTRFAPVWGLYTLCLLMGLFLMVGANRAVNFAYDLTQLPSVMALVNCGYALLVAQLLLGDLYNTRNCYALHSLPLRRETWYGTNILSGLTFSLIPTGIMGIMAAFLLIGSVVNKSGLLLFYVLVAINLQFLFFFSLAMLCGLCAGNRLGMIALYGVVNFAAAALSLVISSLYAPLLFGVAYDFDAYLPAFPMGWMLENNQSVLTVEGFYDALNKWENANRAYPLALEFTAGSGWGYYLRCGGLSLVMLIAGCLLYRKRELEVAGDLLAVKALRPVFQVCASIGCAWGFQLVYRAFAMSSKYLWDYPDAMTYFKEHGWFGFALVGLVVGWYAARMLLNRSTKVFQKNAIPGLAGMAVVLVLSLGLCALDPLGLVKKIPDLDEVATVAFNADNFGTGGIVLDDPGDRENLQRLHRLALEQHITADQVYNREDDAHVDSFSIHYTLNNGKTVSRRYYFWVDSEAGRLAKTFFTRPEVVLSNYGEPLDRTKIETMYISGYRGDSFLSDPEEIQGLLDAITADCLEGRMARGAYYHTGYYTEGEKQSPRASIYISFSGPDVWGDVQVYGDSTNTNRRLADQGILEKIGFTVREGDYYQARDAWDAAQDAELLED